METFPLSRSTAIIGTIFEENEKTPKIANILNDLFAYHFINQTNSNGKYSYELPISRKRFDFTRKEQHVFFRLFENGK